MASYEEWKAAKEKLKSAKDHLGRVQQTLHERGVKIASTLLLKGGQTGSSSHFHRNPGVPAPLDYWPTEDQILQAENDFKTALDAEYAAYTNLSPGDKANLKRD